MTLTTEQEQSFKNKDKIEELEKVRESIYEHIAKLKLDLDFNRAEINTLSIGMREGSEFMFKGNRCMITQLTDYFPRYVERTKKDEWSKSERHLYLESNEYEILKY